MNQTDDQKRGDLLSNNTTATAGFSKYSIGDLKINPGLVLAPMSGVTTSPFRRLIKELNPGCVGLVITEFVSVEGMTRMARKTLEMMRYREEERPFGIQIFGYDIGRMRDAALMVQDAGADLVDINCGCPAPKVVRKGGGAELMRQPQHLSKIFNEVRKAIKIPLTMKMRSGWDDNSRNCLEVAKIAEKEGVQGITIHGRTRAQLYRGIADWEWVQRAASEVSIPVCGSGDICDRNSALERLNRDGIVGGYIGRAAMYNPYVFSEICGREVPNLRTDALKAIDVLWRYLELLEEDFSPTATIGKLKQLASQMARGHGWRKLILRAMSLDQQKEIMKQIKESILTGAPVFDDELISLDSAGENKALAEEQGADCADSCDYFAK